MQLEASKRHASARPARPLHKRLARRRAAQARLFAGGVAALAGSAVGWLFGLTLPLHLTLLGLGFAGGFFWRFAGVGHRAERWAFAWIEPQAGLSYQTALELPASDTSPLGEAVLARAARAERDGITEDEAREALLQLDPLWDELFPAEQTRIVQLLVERVDVGMHGLEMHLRPSGLSGLVREVASGRRAAA